MPFYIEIVSISNCFQFISIRSYTTRKYFILSSNCIVPSPLPSNLIIWDECRCKVKGGPAFVVPGVWCHFLSGPMFLLGGLVRGGWWLIRGGGCFVCGQSKCQCCQHVHYGKTQTRKLKMWNLSLLHNILQPWEIVVYVSVVFLYRLPFTVCYHRVWTTLGESGGWRHNQFNFT